jgi:hypothetical protein
MASTSKSRWDFSIWKEELIILLWFPMLHITKSI